MFKFRNDLPEDLIDWFKEETCGLFIGAGLSVGSSLPTWEKLLLELLELAKKSASLRNSKSDEILDLIKNKMKYLTAAEELREILSFEIHEYIKKRFADPKITPSKVHKLIMKIPFRFIVTTNYDSLIEDAYAEEFKKSANLFTYEDPADINYSLLNKQKFILKAHGDAKRAPQNIILTDKDYRRILYKEIGYQSVLQVIFSSNHLLFIGTSLTDPETNLLLSYLHCIFHGGSPHHYALIDETKINQTEADRWRKDYNIHIITYNPKDNHKEIYRFLNKFKKEVVC